MVHEVGVEMSQEEDKIEEVSINSVYLNNKQLLITAQLEMQVSNNALKVPYKIDTSSEEIPDTVVLNIINLNIDAIKKETRNCKTNRGH